MRGLKEREIYSLAAYKGTAFQGINAYLRGEDLDARGCGEDEESIIPAVEKLDAIMEGSVISEPVTVYRGMDLEDQFSRNFDQLEGELFRFDGFTSTSLTTERAEVFAAESAEEEEDPVMVEIKVPAGTNGIWMDAPQVQRGMGDRKSTRLNSSHSQISYAVFCLK